MNTYFFFLFVIVTSLISCKEKVIDCQSQSSMYCNLQDPVKELGWLNDIVKGSSSNTRVYISTYNGREGIFITTQYESGLVLSSYRTCDNQLLYQSGGVIGSTFPRDFDEKNTYRKQVYP